MKIRSIIGACALMVCYCICGNSLYAQNGNGSIEIGSSPSGVTINQSSHKAPSSGEEAISKPTDSQASSNKIIQSKDVLSDNDPVYFPPEGEAYFLKETGNKISAKNLLKMNPEVRDRMIEEIDRYNVVSSEITKADLEKLPLSSQHHVQNLPHIFKIK